MTLLEMSLSASAIILVTAALRLLAGGRLPRRMYVLLWDIAMLRLLLPVKITSSLSLGALLSGLRSGRPEDAVKDVIHAMTGGAGATALGEAAKTAMTQPQAADLPADAPSLLSRIGDMITPERALLAVWLAGALLLAAHFALAYARSMRLFRESLPDTHPETDMFLRAHPMKRRVRACLSGHIASPLSYGILRPVILLPRGMDHGNVRALHYVLLHELMHIRALDAVRKLLAVACLCLHWMNPLVALMFLLVNRDMELLCDEHVLAASPGDARREYALTLLAMEERRARLSPVASSFSENAIEERIKAMMNMKKKSAASLLLAFAIVVTSSAALATSAPEEAASGISNAPVAPAASAAPAALDAPKAPQIQAATGGTANQTETTGRVTEGAPFLTRESWEGVYAKYAPFGLGYDAECGRLTYEGKLVRRFEDMYPVGKQTEAGTVCAFETGEVDVYAVRDLTGPILRNADGSFDPSGELLGLRAATREEFDALTRERESIVKEPYESGPVSVAEDVQATVQSGVVLYNGKPDVVWWTADEYRAWMEKEREVLLELAREKAWAYTGSDGWFQWTQEKVEETMALYADILRQIEDGALVSKTVDGEEDTMLMLSVPSDVELERSTQAVEGSAVAVTETIAQSGTEGLDAFEENDESEAAYWDEVREIE